MSFRSGFLYKTMLAGLAALCFCGSSRMQALLVQDRQELGFTTLPPLENAPPVLAFTTVALGGFRGLISNVLWLRANDLQEQDRFFEMVQLADWITKLDPHASTVWTFQEWNMAYNISVKCKDFEERWKWVRRGINLLHEGLKYNPGDVQIYKDMAWLFRHKIGQNLDDAHMTYKLHWAQEMQDVLGGHPDFAALLHPQTAEDRERLRRLTNDYQMDPAFVQEIDTNYGPLDWRLPDAHAIYWAELGMKNGTKGEKEILRRDTENLLAQSCMRGGALPPYVKKVTPENFILWPNLDLVPKVNEICLKTANAETNPMSVATITTFHKNFLKEAVVLLYEYNRTRDADHWFNYLKQNFTNALTREEASLSASDYALSQIQADLSDNDPAKATRLILGAIRQEYFAVLQDDLDTAASFKNLAMTEWRTYQARLPKSPTSYGRVKLESFEKLSEYQLEAMPISPHAIEVLRAALGAHPPGQSPSTNAPPANPPRTDST